MRKYIAIIIDLIFIGAGILIFLLGSKINMFIGGLAVMLGVIELLFDIRKFKMWDK